MDIIMKRTIQSMFDNALKEMHSWAEKTKKELTDEVGLLSSNDLFSYNNLKLGSL